MVCVVLCACARTPVYDPPVEDDDPVVTGPELCDARDNDRDGLVDEGFIDDAGVYRSDEHCGACGRACLEVRPNAVSMGCEELDSAPACVASECRPGFARTTAGGCAPVAERLCLPCSDDSFCGLIDGARCASVFGERRCVVDCDVGCPDGYRCAEDDRGEPACVPAVGGCVCDGSADFIRACSLPEGEPECPGTQACRAGQLEVCRAPHELCDGEDNDCDGEVDETFRNELGVYASDEHCGACGVDCTEDRPDGRRLVCGRDPFAPTCGVHCPDRDDGVQVGDRLDADGRIDNGCECTVVSLEDPVGDVGGQLDENCDGADGEVPRGYYVAVDGDDDGPGSPTRPLRSISEALTRAAESLAERGPEAGRDNIYVASGTYTEVLDLRDGVSIHGGYRRDFLARDADGREVVVIAPASEGARGGAALRVEPPSSARAVGTTPTIIEGLSLRGADAEGLGAPALGALIQRPGTRLVMRDMRIMAGRPGPGASGLPGTAGAAPITEAATGEAQQAARENAAHACLPQAGNRADGGSGGRNACAGIDVSGGRGGHSECPEAGRMAGAGTRGRGTASAPGGPGGDGGDHVSGPIENSASCPSPPCCGLADFSVPTDFRQPRPGEPGSDGQLGQAGQGCGDGFGTFQGSTFAAPAGTSGAAGQPGGGGGGGGAGGGAVMKWFEGLCEFADGFGGGGGGGGAGGCGGEPGRPGQSGGPSVALLLVTDGATGMPSLERVAFETSPGGRGGDGGNGGDGGLGGTGATGGSLAPELRSTPTLAGPLQGQRGGRGGNGGGGGGGGGGCGGASVGMWVIGIPPAAVDVAAVRESNEFALAEGGDGGRGGGGAAPGGPGADGGQADVLLR